jgi:hypothetical protein
MEIVTEVNQLSDPQWNWNPVVKQDGEAMNLLKRKQLPDSEVNMILQDSVEVLARCRPPNAPDGASTGLVVGYVQSGKTLSFTTVASMAADNGYPLIIILSGVSKPLKAQTITRLRRDLDLWEPGGNIQLIETGTSNPNLAQGLNQSLEVWSGPVSDAFPRPTVIIAVMKHHRHLGALTDEIKGLNLAGKPCLIIDDEADQHGLNTKINRNDESSTYRALLDLREAIPNHTYLQYTATPQANVLMSVLDSLSPEFGWVLEAGSKYTGGHTFFREHENLINVIPDHEIDKDGHERLVDEGPPNSLLAAMRQYFIGVAAQAIHRVGNEPTQKLRSMLVHPSMRQIDHLKYKTWVDLVRDRWIATLKPDSDPDLREIELKRFEDSWGEMATISANIDNPEGIPAFDEIAEMLVPAMQNTRPAWEVNSRKDAASWDVNNWSLSRSHILIGGENLGRGFTVEGLTVTYMPRGKGSGYVDTIEQRARFFGYKRDYVDMCRVWLDDQIASSYYEYVDHEDYLMSELKNLTIEGSASLPEWRRVMLLALRLKPTRPSVLPKNLYRQLRVEDWTVQNRPHDIELSDQVKNSRITNAFIASMSGNLEHGIDQSEAENRHVVNNAVPIKSVLEGLLVQLTLSRFDAPDFSALEVALGVELDNNPHATADVYMMSAAADSNIRKRTLTDRGVVQPFQGASPADGSVYPGDRQLHGSRMTVQIHNIEVTNPDDNSVVGPVPLIAVWIPKSMARGVLVETI